MKEEELFYIALHLSVRLLALRKRSDKCFWSEYSSVAKSLAARLACLDRPNERIQSGRAGQRRRRQVRADRPVCHRHLHREIRPDHRGLLPKGDRGGLVALRAGDPRHSGDGAVRLHERPVHKERTGLHSGLQPGQPAVIPGT